MCCRLLSSTTMWPDLVRTCSSQPSNHMTSRARYLSGETVCGTATLRGIGGAVIASHSRTRESRQGIHDGQWSFRCLKHSSHVRHRVLRTADSTLIEERPNRSPSPMASTEITSLGTDDPMMRHWDSQHNATTVHNVSGVAVICVVGLLRRDNGRRRHTGHLSRNWLDWLPPNLC